MTTRVEIKSLKAELTVGLNKLYSEEYISIHKFVAALTDSQLKLQKELNIKMSAKITPCRIIFSGQNEKSMTISFINYPKFPLVESRFRKGVEFIAHKLMDELSQNRVVIEYPDYTVMFEKSEQIDPKINSR